ncbi:MAG: alpha/beta fold hydrolase [Ilumatobacteraceae bacterium]
MTEKATATKETPTVVHNDEIPPILGANPFVGLSRQQIVAALARLGQRVLVEPGVVAAHVLDTSRRLLEVGIGRSDSAPEHGDKRFVDEVWTKNPVYHRLMQSYLVQRNSVLRLVDDVELDHKSRERARFALSLFTEAAAPTNNLLANPTALAKAMQTRGRSLVDGLRHFGHDVRRNGGLPTQVDTRPFKVGRNIGVTPGEVVYRTDVFELIQYSPSTERVYERPLVVIPPQINKFYITDLAAGRSLVEHTVAAGVPYFTMSWFNPTAAQRDWNLDTYVAACKEAIEVACDISGSTDANVLGICAGGVTLACLLGHLAAIEEPLVHSATFMVAGLDMSQDSLISLLASEVAIDAARRRSHKAGVLDGKDMAKVFAWLRPNDLVWNYWVNNYLLGQNPAAFDILYWNADTTRLPAGLHSDFLDLFSNNGLCDPGAVKVLGTPIDLGVVTCDAYVVAGATDHIIPWIGAYQTTQLLGGKTEFVLGSSGHIQSIVNPPTNKKSSYLIGTGAPPAAAAEWRDKATQQQGSWWDHWHSWLGSRSGGKRAAPKALGNAEHRPLEKAPGRYVHLK